MTGEVSVVLYTTSTCAECPRVAAILESLGIPFTKRVIDLDPEAQTDALMLKITSVLAIAIGDAGIRAPIDQLTSLLAERVAGKV
jgi:glutaredoxin